jgi:hypothetical protein
VHDAALVGRLERLGDLQRDLQRLVPRERAAREPLREVLPLDELHRQEAHTVRFVKTVDRRDARVVQRRQQLRLALEAGQPLRALREHRGQDLDRHLAVERGVERFPHHPHATLADLLDDAVVQKLAARFDLHHAPLPPGF